MKWKTLSLFAVGSLFVAPSGAFACDFYLNSVFHRIPSSLSIGVGAQIQPGDGTVIIASADLGIGIGNRLGLFPAVGLCHESAEDPGEEDFDEISFGGTAALKLFSSSDNKLAVNAQAGVATVSFDGFRETTIPIVGALQYMASPTVGIFGGGGIQMQQFKGGIFDESESDPIIIAGLNIALSRITVTGGVQFQMGEDDTDTSINVALRLPIGR